MIVGIIPNASTAEILLNNLDEADYNLQDVSVIMRDPKLRNAIAPEGGPLKGVRHDEIAARLAQAGLDPAEARGYQDAVTQGKVLVAMEAPPEAAETAREMFADQSGERIKVV